MAAFDSIFLKYSSNFLSNVRLPALLVLNVRSAQPHGRQSMSTLGFLGEQGWNRRNIAADKQKEDDEEDKCESKKEPSRGR